MEKANRHRIYIRALEIMINARNEQTDFGYVYGYGLCDATSYARFGHYGGDIEDFPEIMKRKPKKLYQYGRIEWWFKKGDFKIRIKILEQAIKETAPKTNAEAQVKRKVKSSGKGSKRVK